MKRTKRILLALGCAALLAASWITAVTAKSDAQKQRELIDQAAGYLQDEIYVLAVPLLEEAAGYQDDYTLEAETVLKEVYLHLSGKGNYTSRYTQLLKKQMAQKDATPDIFQEAAQYYLDLGKTTDALSILRDGIEKTESAELVQLYEDQRYAYRMSRDFYDDAGELFQGTSQVMLDGRWGLASSTGLLQIPCEYDKISTFSGDRAIVQKDGVISAVDGDNNRVALLHGDAKGFGNFSENRMGLQTAEGWLLASGSFETGSTAFEEMGVFSDGGAPVKYNGKWGIITSDGSEWLLEPQYDRIIQDGLGRCGSSWKLIFVVRNGSVYLLSEGEEIGGPYEDARPFNDRLAAVKQNGKWGFIDQGGTVQIDFQFDNAQSFGGHLAAVQEGELWGYISLSGEFAIEPQFIEAKTFQNGSAPVKTGLGWQFITLLEYEGGGGFF